MGLPRTQDPFVVTRFPVCGKAITPDDTDALTNHQGDAQPQTVYVGADGDVVVVPAGNDIDQTLTFSLLAGQVVPVICSHVLATGTTATGLIGLF